MSLLQEERDLETYKDKQGRRQCDNGGRDWSYKPENDKDCQEPSKPRMQQGKIFPWSLQKEYDFRQQPPEPCRDKFLYCELPNLW